MRGTHTAGAPEGGTRCTGNAKATSAHLSVVGIHRSHRRTKVRQPRSEPITTRALERQGNVSPLISNWHSPVSQSNQSPTAQK